MLLSHCVPTEKKKYKSVEKELPIRFSLQMHMRKNAYRESPFPRRKLQHTSCLSYLPGLIEWLDLLRVWFCKEAFIMIRNCVKLISLPFLPVSLKKCFPMLFTSLTGSSSI